MSGINDVVKAYGCVLKKWMCHYQPYFVLCACVFLVFFLFPGGVLSAAECLEMHHTLFCFVFLFLLVCFEVIASNVTDNESVKLFFILRSAAHMNRKPDQILPSLLSTKLISTQLNRDIVCTVR